MKRRIRIAGATLAVAAGLISAVATPASATKPPGPSCAGLIGASFAGDPGRQAEQVQGYIGFANNQGEPPGTLVFSSFGHRNPNPPTAGICLD
jgi:hypothetical protein